MKTFKKGGIHPAADKLTADIPVEEMELQAELRLILAQSIGAPSRCIVKVGDEVERFDVIAEAGGFVSVPLHAPRAGKVTKIEKIRNERGLWQEAVTIAVDSSKADAPLPEPRSEQEIASLRPEDIVTICRDAGIVGLGGATFPTHVKLTIPEGKSADTILINGAECEPYLTCDDRLMREHSREIVDGTRLLMRAARVSKAVIGIEENKPEAIAAMDRAVASEDGISVVVLKKKYPQGSEKQLIAAVTGREVPAGALPVDVNVIVDNVATAFALHEAVAKRIPLTRRIVTVTGPGLSAPGNYLADVGTSIDALIARAGGMPEDTGKVVSGGPMMGRAASQTDAPSVKGMGGILILPEDMSHRKPSQPCIRCSQCVGVCPMGLEPYLLMSLSQHSLWEDMKREDALSCLECGSCSYVCPASRPLLDYIRLGKSEIRKKKI